MSNLKVKLEKLDGEYLATAQSRINGKLFMMSDVGNTPKEALKKCRAQLEQQAEDCWDAIEDIEFKRYTDLTEVEVADKKSPT